MPTLKHTNISIRIPTEHAALVIDAAKGSKTLISRWAADRLVKAAALETGRPVPAPAAPSRDRIRQAAKAAGMTEEAFKSHVLNEAVTIVLSSGGRSVEIAPSSGEGGGELRVPRVRGSGDGPETIVKAPPATTPAAAVRAALVH